MHLVASQENSPNWHSADCRNKQSVKAYYYKEHLHDLLYLFLSHPSMLLNCYYSLLLPHIAMIWLWWRYTIVNNSLYLFINSTLHILLSCYWSSYIVQISGLHTGLHDLESLPNESKFKSVFKILMPVYRSFSRASLNSLPEDSCVVRRIADEDSVTSSDRRMHAVTW